MVELAVLMFICGVGCYCLLGVGFLLRICLRGFVGLMLLCLVVCWCLLVALLCL